MVPETSPYVETHQNQPTETNENARVDYVAGSRADCRIMKHQLFLIELNHAQKCVKNRDAKNVADNAFAMKSTMFFLK